METVGRTVTKIVHLIIWYQKRDFVQCSTQLDRVKQPELGRSNQQIHEAKQINYARLVGRL